MNLNFSSILKNKTKTKNLITKYLSMLSFGLILVTSTGVQASSQDKLNQVNSQLNSARGELSRLHSEKTSLANEVATLDAHINEIQLQIDQSQAQIDVTNENIAATNAKIAETELQLKAQKETLNAYLREMYLDGQVSLAELIIKSDSFSDFVDQNEYMETMRVKIKETTDKISALKNELDQKKKSLEEDRANIEKLKAQQEADRAQIDAQRAAKANLLAQVQNDEAKYQSYVGNLQAQQNALQAEIARIAAAASAPRGIFGGGYKSYGRVNKGDVIGYQGNSGYSTGTHLHFELQVGGRDTNPLPYIQNGTFTNPLPGSRITQYWGETGRVAGYARHAGMDMSAGYGAAVHAAADGEIIARVTGQGNTYPGQVSYGNYVMIRHSNGWITIYGHLK